MQIPSISSVEHVERQGDDSQPGMGVKMIDGIYSVRLNTISECPDNIRLRNVDKAFVEEIKKELNNTVTPQPLALYIPDIEKKDFNPDQIENYIFFCLGGNHLRLACESAGKTHIAANIYTELTEEECLFIGKSHNDISHYVKEMTNLELIQLFRRQLKHTTGMDVLNERVKDLTLIKKWRERISKLLPAKKDIKSFQPLINIASMRDSEYLKVMTIFEMYKEADLKDQKSVKKGQKSQYTLNAVTPWRSMMTIEDLELSQLLDRVLAKEWSLDEFQKRCQEIKTMNKLKKKMVEVLNTEWDTIVYQYFNGEKDNAETALLPYVRLSDSTEFEKFVKKLKTENSDTKGIRTSGTVVKADLVFLGDDEVCEETIREIHAKNIQGNIKLYTIISPSPNLQFQASKVADFGYRQIAYIHDSGTNGRELKPINIFNIAQFGNKTDRVLVKPGAVGKEMFLIKERQTLAELFHMFCDDVDTMFIKCKSKSELLMKSLKEICCSQIIFVCSDNERKSLKRKYHFIEE